MIKPILTPEVVDQHQDHMTVSRDSSDMTGSHDPGHMMPPDQLMLVVEVGQVKLALPPRLSKIVQLFNEVRKTIGVISKQNQQQYCLFERRLT